MDRYTESFALELQLVYAGGAGGQTNAGYGRRQPRAGGDGAGGAQIV